MFGKSMFGKKLFAESSVKTEFVPSEDFAFNTYGLQNDTQYGIHISDYDVEMPERDFVTADVPGGHGLTLLEDWFRKNPIKLNGWVSAITKEQLDLKIHEFMRNIHGQGGILYIKNAGTYKELVTTLQRAIFENKHYSTVKKKFSLEFSGVKSFWRDKDYTSVFYSAQSGLTLNGQMNNSGSTVAYPIFIAIFSAASSITAIELENTTTGETITITENISASDVIIFDSERNVVTKNGVDIEFSGRMLSLPVGINSFTMTLTGTSATHDLTAKHKNQYLTP
jgi:phage-related protein